MTFGKRMAGLNLDLDWDRNWKRARKAFRRDELLRRAGLQERSAAGDFMGGIGLFALGILVGAGLGLMFAPRRGDEMRNMMSDAWSKRRGRDDLRHLGVEAAPPPAGGI
jgi:hypothetical protein